jgi:type II secretory ATPase GspE/PulE/Tfp pilus assembly ATPase PilB-like protein
MIGEMRDLETASVAIEASLTGHLVLSTLHTNSAPETVTRLLDIGLNPINFSDSLLGILAQRLVRRLCPLCKEPYTPIAEEYEEMQSILEGVELPQEVPSLETASFYKAKGCPACGESGYKGRLGIYELLKGSGMIKRLIKKGADTEEIFMQAKRDGMVTLRQEGIIRVLQGITDLQEVKRVVVS